MDENVEIRTGGGVSLQMDASEAVPGLPERDPYQDFLDRNENNLLLDFSYAGYNHGESAPEEIIITEMEVDLDLGRQELLRANVFLPMMI